MAASDLGLDRLELRRRNLVVAREMPYALASIHPNEGIADSSCDSGDYPIPFDRCVAEAGWKEKAKLDGKLIDGRWHGLGVACFIEGGGSGPRENARMHVERDGSISVYVGSSAVGQGIETIMAQIAADALELPVERVRIMHGSTTYLHEGFGSYGSRGTVMGGSAIVVAANALLEKFRVEAAARFGVAAQEVAVADGVAQAPDGRNVTLAEIAANTTLAADGTFSSSKPTYTYGTSVAHVAVDA